MASLYLAGPLFSVAEREFNAALAAEVQRQSANLNVVLPQQRAQQFLGAPEQNQLIYRDCLDSIDQADFLVAVLDGPDADSGTAVEMGYALAKRKPILGIRSDFRISEERGLNLMVALACTELLLDPRATISSLAQGIVTFSAARVGPKAAMSR